MTINQNEIQARLVLGSDTDADIADSSVIVKQVDNFVQMLSINKHSQSSGEPNQINFYSS